MPVFEIVGEALHNLTDMSRSEMEDRVREALVHVGLARAGDDPQVGRGRQVPSRRPDASRGLDESTASKIIRVSYLS
jgi:hypothetical protein